MDLSESSGTAAEDRAAPRRRRPGDARPRAQRGPAGRILWERLWPALASIATAVGLFLALSWLGLWLWLPPVGRAIGLGVFCLIARGRAAAAAAPAAAEPDRQAPPSRPQFRTDASARHHDLRQDRRRDRRRSCASRCGARISSARCARRRRCGPDVPMPRVAARDPMALRALVLVLVIATFFVAGGDRMKRVQAAFDWQGAITPANFRIDAWISPPPYTGEAAADPARPAAGRAGAGRERADRGAGRQRAGHPRQRPGQSRRRHHRRARRAGTDGAAGGRPRRDRAALRHRRRRLPPPCALRAI